MTKTSSLLPLLFAAITLSCSGTQSTDADCSGGKCDSPGSTADVQCQADCDGDSDCFQECRDAAAIGFCEARREDAMSSSQRAFTKDAIRWACSDVEGVNTNRRDDRGQEYCEYFAVVQPPPLEDGTLPQAVDLGRNTNFGSTDLSLELTEDQIFALEDEPDAVVGQCVFTSWHMDIREDLPACADGGCPELSLPEGRIASWATTNTTGFRFDSDFGRMKIGINSNNAASDLIQRCMAPVAPVADEDDMRNDHYMRGCWETYELFKTEWRRSDPSICVASMRLSECGCGVDTDGDGKADITDIDDISFALIPPQPVVVDGEEQITLRGFSLGTWSGASELPAGCRYVETGDDSQTLVTCDLTASDILGSATDPKGKCRTKYGDNVVVHVPLPSGALVCDPPEDGQFADSCGDFPQVVGDEGQSGSGGGDCCKVCVTSQACGDSCISADATCNQAPGCACQGEPE